jgi:hypothetical protein
MRLTIIFFSLLISTLGFAKSKNFEVQVNEVSVNGNLDAQPRKLKIKPDQAVVISRGFDASGTNTIVEMTVTDDDSKMKDGILVKLAIIEDKNGTKKTIGTPQMIVKSGQEAQITEGKKGETPFIKASLIGTRIQ